MGAEPYFWQPRERLVGVYFPEDSQLTTIDGASYSGSADNYWRYNHYKNGLSGTNRTLAAMSDKAAFERCDNLRFLILPNSLTSIGKSAFYACSSIVDMNIPSNVTSIGAYAFQGCTSVRVLPRPTGDGISNTAYDDCSFEDESTIYIMGGAPTVDDNGNKVYDNGTNGFIFKKNGDSWEAKSLAGATGEDDNKVFVFPDSGDFSADSDRRIGIAYDYIDRDGYKQKNEFPDGGVTSYKIADGFAKDKWCKNVIMPKAVTEIGANAFNNSGVKYMETYATKIGKNAFTGANNSSCSEQWYYFHWTGTETADSYSGLLDSAFTTLSSSTAKRYIVFESAEMKAAVESAFSTTKYPNLMDKATIYYQIPVYAHVYSEDGETVNGKGISLSQSDMTERFFNDSDYVSGYVNNSVLKQGDNVILYTKRLSGYNFDQIKLATGGWSTSGGNIHSNPTLNYMDSTVWYSLASDADTAASASYQTSTTASAQYTSTASRVDIYTKKIAAPEKLADKTYEFGKAYAGKGTLTDALTTDPAESQGTFTFASALDLRVDYVATIGGFAYPNGNALSPADSYVKNVRHAGTYSLVIGLDSRWGSWKSDYQSENRKATVTVERQKFDLTSLDKIPEFVTSDGVSLRGNNTTLYRHNNGWFLTQQNGEEPIASVVVTNGYVYATGRDMTLDLNGYNGNDEKSDYGYLMSTNSYPVNMPNEYYTTYTFAVKFIEGAPGQTDYEFYYGAADDDTRFNDLYDDALGLRLDRKTATSARVNKRWYIVTETNFFVDSAEVNVNENTAPYAPVFKDGKPVYTWTYEDELDVKTPKLAYNRADNPVQPQVEIAYTPVGGRSVTIKEKGTVTEAGALGYYINSAMPVGEYVVTVYGDAVNLIVDGESKNYLEIVNTYTLTVTPKALNAQAVSDLHATIRGGANGNAFPLDGKKLHDDISDNKAALEQTLNVKYAAATADNYWKSLANGELPYDNGVKVKLYDSNVTITYNREGSGNFIYYSYDAMLESLALANANEYKFYFSISAKNYVTVGGADSSDRQYYDFNTVWYTDMKISDIYKVLIGKVESPYFKDVPYTGTDAHVSVQPSQYYDYTFNDVNYVDAGRVFVTLTLYNAKLAAWNTTLSSKDFTESEIADASKYFELSQDGKSIKVYYNILPATNSWSVVPQMPSWSFNGFDRSVNFITAGLAFGGAEVRYSLSSDRTTWTDPFTVDSNGMVSDATAEALNKLKPGTYYLRSEIGNIYADESQTVINVNGLTVEYISGTPLATIIISKAVNGWTKTPTVMTWTWGSYNPARNTVSATATYPALMPTYVNSDGNKVVDTAFVYTNGGAALPVVTFSISKAGESSPIAGLESFTVVDDDIAEILAGLHAGTYTLTTYVNESDYYTAIAATSLDFVIAQAVNSWTTTPQITQWTWGQFNENVNIILAEAKFNGGDGSEGSQDNAIKFTILKQVDSVLRIMQRVPVSDKLTEFTLVNGALSEDVIAELQALPAGTYYFRATKEGNNDYADIQGIETTDIPFTIAKAENSWITTPGMTGWLYNAYANNFVAGELTYGETSDVVYKVGVNKIVDGKMTFEEKFSLEYTVVKGVISLTEATIGKLNALSVGNYVLTAHLDGTDNYLPADYSAQFTVSKTNNS